MAAKRGRPKKQTVPADFYVGFTGSIPQTNLPEPKLGDQVEYTIRGTVRGVGEKLRKDGETRNAVTVDVEDAWPAGADGPPTTGLMFDRNGNDATNKGATTDAAAAADSYDPDHPDNTVADNRATEYDDGGNPVKKG